MEGIQHRVLFWNIGFFEGRRHPLRQRGHVRKISAVIVPPPAADVSRVRALDFDDADLGLFSPGG